LRFIAVHAGTSMVFAGILRFEDDLETKLKCTMKVL